MIKDHCGVFGIYGHSQASWLTYLGLYALQHRGEESCGIISSDGKRIYVKKGMGLVADVISQEDIQRLTGHLACGHVRYSTTGSSRIENAQPLHVDFLKGSLAIAHNGNLVNSHELRQKLERAGSIFQTSTDSEIVLQLMARSRKHSLLDRLRFALKKIQGAYSLVFMTEDTLLGVRDPHGFRPLCLGEYEGALCLASESCAFDLIGARFLQEVTPGHIVVINRHGFKFVPSSPLVRRAYCIFEHVYFARPDSYIFGQTVHLARQQLGQNLAREHPVAADMVIPVPDSGSSAALGFSHYSGIPLEIGIIRNHYVGRTFIQPYQHIRDLGVRVKFNLLRDVIRDRKVVIVDDSIVRGTTTRKRVGEFRRVGAKEVHLRISCPPHRFPCYYGIDFPTRRELVAVKYPLDKIREFLGVDSLGYLSLQGMLEAMINPARHYCTACFSGKYPLKTPAAGKFSLEKKGCS